MLNPGMAVRLAVSMLWVASLCSAPAAAKVYTFSQSGFDGGGSVAGTFTGTDVDGNGQLSSFAGEITDFSVTFSGDGFVSGFTHTLADLFALVFDLGVDPLLGNGAGIDPEGILSVDAQFVYSTGLGPNGFNGGFVENIATGVNSVTANDLVVVPAPGVLWLLGIGLAGLAASRRSAPRGRAIPAV